VESVSAGGILELAASMGAFRAVTEARDASDGRRSVESLPWAWATVVYLETDPSLAVARSGPPGI